MPLAINLSDEHFAQKTWEQGMRLSEKNRDELLRKMVVLVGARRQSFERVIFAEIAGLVNDCGDMERCISPHELEAPRMFREEVGQDLSVA